MANINLPHELLFFADASKSFRILESQDLQIAKTWNCNKAIPWQFMVIIDIHYFSVLLVCNFQTLKIFANVSKNFRISKS